MELNELAYIDIIKGIMTEKKLSQQKFADIIGVNQTTVSHQLRLLRNLGVVRSERDGKIIYYSIKNEIINEIMLKGVEFLTL